MQHASPPNTYLLGWFVGVIIALISYNVNRYFDFSFVLIKLFSEVSGNTRKRRHSITNGALYLTGYS